MKETDLNNKVENIINQFENIESRPINEEWNSRLMQKMARNNSIENRGLTAGKVSFVAVLFIILNIGFFVKTVSNNPIDSSERSSELKTISSELFINSNVHPN
ncbi:MAG: hypothetical protein PSX81_00395 [bacterium]|nr:hypothetical protein [bacterium]